MFQEWTFATDPKNLQPTVGRTFRRAADHLRNHPPEGMTQERLTELLASIEAPRGVRIAREVREILETTGMAPEALSLALAAKAEELGLQPYRALDPLDPIDAEEVHLVCWMAVS